MMLYIYIFFLYICTILLYFIINILLAKSIYITICSVMILRHNILHTYDVIVLIRECVVGSQDVKT